MKTKNTKRVQCFKRWSRKGYAVFASLGREVKIGVLALTMATACLQGLAIEADTTRTERLEAVAVTALRGSAAVRSLAEPVTVVDPQSLKYSAIASIEVLLDLTPSIDVRSRGARGAQADISIRGASPDQAMILLNGVNFTDARTGHQSHSLPLPLSSVAAVDFIKNTQSIGAYSGALDYRTISPQRNSLQAEISGGMFGTYSATISGAARGKRNSIYIASSYDHSDGYVHNTDFSRFNIYLRAQHADAHVGLLDFQAGFQMMDFGSNGFYSLAHPNQWEATKTALGSLVWSKDIIEGLSLNALVSYRLNTDRYELYRPGSPDIPPTYKGANYHLTDNVGASLWASYDWGRAGESSLGVDYTYNHIWSTVLGDRTGAHQIGGVSYTALKDRDAASYYLRHSVDLGAVDLGASLSVNATSHYGVHPLWSALVGYNFLCDFRAELSAIASMRLPSFTDLYYTTATHVGNSDLVPEHATTLNLSLGYGRGSWSASAAVYYRMGRDLIDWVRSVDETIWHSRQITTMNTLGVELSGSYRPARGWLAGVTLSYGYINSDKEFPSGMISKYALDYMRHKASLGVDFRIVRNLVLNVTGSYYDRNGIYEIQAGRATSYAPYFLLDSRLTWDIASRVSLWAECSNILGQSYFDFAGLTMPGRWFMAGLRVKII